MSCPLRSDRMGACIVLVLGLVHVVALNAFSSPLSDTTRSESHSSILSRVRTSLTASALLPRGTLTNAVGTRKGGLHVSIAYRSVHGMALGLELVASNMGTRTESVPDPNGPDAHWKRELSLTRLAVFGQYGPRLGPLRPFGEIILGLNTLGTIVQETDPSTSEKSKTNESSRALAAGLGGGVEVGLPSALESLLALSSSALRVEYRHVFGGDASFRKYDRDVGRPVTRSTTTTMRSVSLGLTFNF